MYAKIKFNEQQKRCLIGKFPFCSLSEQAVFLILGILETYDFQNDGIFTKDYSFTKLGRLAKLVGPITRDSIEAITNQLVRVGFMETAEVVKETVCIRIPIEFYYIAFQLAYNVDPRQISIRSYLDSKWFKHIDFSFMPTPFVPGMIPEYLIFLCEENRTMSQAQRFFDQMPIAIQQFYRHTDGSVGDYIEQQFRSFVLSEDYSAAYFLSKRDSLLTDQFSLATEG